MTFEQKRANIDIFTLQLSRYKKETNSGWWSKVTLTLNQAAPSTSTEFETSEAVVETPFFRMNKMSVLYNSWWILIWRTRACLCPLKSSVLVLGSLKCLGSSHCLQKGIGSQYDIKGHNMLILKSLDGVYSFSCWFFCQNIKS